MKKILTAILLASMVASLAYAGDDVTPAAKAGAVSLNFTFGGLGAFNLGGSGPAPFNTPAGISVSFFLGNTDAFRVGLQAQNWSQTIPWTGTVSGTDGSNSALGLGLSGDYLKYIGTSSRVRPYLGLGVLVTYSTNDHKDPAAAGQTQQETQDTQPAGLALGTRGILGAEFFIYNELSVSAEYQLNLYSLTSYSDTKRTVGTTTTATKYGSATQLFGFGALGATVHFYL
jgi:opacity protein-like surface antigen